MENGSDIDKRNKRREYAPVRNVDAGAVALREQLLPFGCHEREKSPGISVLPFIAWL